MEKLIIAAAIAAMGAAGGWWATRLHYEAELGRIATERADERTSAAEQLRLAVKAGDAAAARYEAWKAAQPARQLAAKKETDDAIAADPTQWGGIAIPAGVRAAAESAARAAADPGQPPPAVPTVASPGPTDQPGDARRLP